MSVLSTTVQEQVEEVLVKNNLLTSSQLDDLKKKAKQDNKPLFSLLVSDGHLSDEDLTKTVAQVAKLPYVNLSNTRIEPSVLELLPQDIAERYMAVPLGEIQHRVAIAMLDADNVQAADFISNKIRRPVKVFAASEAGIQHVIKQYQASFSKEALGAMSTIGDSIIEDQDTSSIDRKS